MSLQTLDRSKIGFNGKKRQVYEAWQFSKVYKHGHRVFKIISGWKFVHESECHPRRLKDVQYVSALGGNYYQQETNYISIQDWECGIVKCITENKPIIKYNWFGVDTFVICQKQRVDEYIITITTGKNLYKFQIREI